MVSVTLSSLCQVKQRKGIKMSLEEARLLMGRLRSSKLRDRGAHVWKTLFNLVFKLASLCYNKKGAGNSQQKGVPWHHIGHQTTLHSFDSFVIWVL